jgi:hypothetical protein
VGVLNFSPSETAEVLRAGTGDLLGVLKIGKVLESEAPMLLLLRGDFVGVLELQWRARGDWTDWRVLAEGELSALEIRLDFTGVFFGLPSFLIGVKLRGLISESFCASSSIRHCNFVVELKKEASGRGKL